MLCIHSGIFNKPDLIVDDLSISTSHVFDSELDSIFIKPVIVDTACLDDSENPKIQEHKLMVSLSLLVIIVGRLVILDQIIFC
jgi:hypothetical protein